MKESEFEGDEPLVIVEVEVEFVGIEISLISMPLLVSSFESLHSVASLSSTNCVTIMFAI